MGVCSPPRTQGSVFMAEARQNPARVQGAEGGMSEGADAPA